MRRLTIVAILNSIFFFFIFAAPSFEIAIKATKFNTTFIRWFEIGHRELRISENHLGMGIDAHLGLIKNLNIKIEIGEIRKYQYLGDVKGVLLSNLALDLEYFIPVGKKVSPLLYIGTKYGPFDYRFPEDTIFEIVNREFHWGIGASYRVKKKSKIVLEIQLYSKNKWWWYGGPDYDEIALWGVEKLNLGFRYCLWDEKFGF